MDGMAALMANLLGTLKAVVQVVDDPHVVGALVIAQPFHGRHHVVGLGYAPSNNLPVC